MKKLVFTVLMLVGIASFAGVVSPFQQFGTETDYQFNTTKNGHKLCKIDLHVHGNGHGITEGVNVWLTSAVLENMTSDLGKVYDMSHFGYILNNDKDEIVWVEKPIITTPVTYFDENNQYETTGYFLGHFDNGNHHLYLAMTALAADGGNEVDSYHEIDDGQFNQDLVNRYLDMDGTDLAGNHVVSFNISTETGSVVVRPFTAVYDFGPAPEYEDHTTGGPLPGVFFAGLLSMGTVFGASKMKKQKRA